MKKISIGLLLIIIDIYGAHAPENYITSYTEEHLAEITRIAFQNPDELFEEYKSEQHDVILKHFQSTFKNFYIIRVILENDKIIGYIKACIRIEPCLELIKKYIAALGQELHEDDMLFQENPCLKIVIGDSQFYMSIEEIAIDEKYRNKGYARQLIQNIIQTTQQHRHSIMKIKLLVKTNNFKAIRLVESEGFKLSTAESMPKQYADYLKKFNSLQYEQYT